jgi:hypothetical protein
MVVRIWVPSFEFRWKKRRFFSSCWSTRPHHQRISLFHHGNELTRRTAFVNMKPSDESLPLVNVSHSGANGAKGYASIAKPSSPANNGNGGSRRPSNQQCRGRPRLDKQTSLQESLRDLSNKISSIIASHTGTVPRLFSPNPAVISCSVLLSLLTTSTCRAIQAPSGTWAACRLR